MKAIDLTGKVLGRLTVINRANPVGKKTAWNCSCSCGENKVITTVSLMSGVTSSCGCLAKQKLAERNSTRATHGWSSHKLYGVWRAMMARCYDPKNKKYADYGGRGITVCEAWHDIDNFCTANIDKWRDGLTMDREDNDGGYSPDNVRWVTQKFQMRNNRRNRHVILNGRKVTLAEAQEITGWRINPTRPNPAALTINYEEA